MREQDWNCDASETPAALDRNNIHGFRYITRAKRRFILDITLIYGPVQLLRKQSIQFLS